MRVGRARSAALILATLTLLITGCSTGPAQTSGPARAAGPTEAAADEFPVTIKHAFGATTIDEPPSRVATVSWVNADVSIALGVVPVGMPATEWGDNDHQSTPWKDAALKKAGASIGTENAPVQYSEADGVNFQEIAKLAPDVILAAYSGLSPEDYDKLSQIAPVVAYPKVAFGTPWQTSTRMIGKALGKPDEAEKLIDDTRQRIREKVAEYPELQGKTFIYGNLELQGNGGINLYTANDNRSRFLSLIGMKQAPIVSNNTNNDAFFIPWSAERANELKSDIVVTWVPKDVTEKEIANHPLLGQLPAVRSGALVAESNQTLTLAISASSPLSLPWALDKFLPQLARAARAAG